MTRYDFSHVYRGLKDFQNQTVDYVFQRMYQDTPPARRFLVADEVGLGKTLVARGLIAKAIEHLDEQNFGRIDVVYICSNADIARQNIKRLNVTGREDFAFASRITMLALELRDLTSNRLNFVSFTPATSFDLKGAMGRREERALLYWLLKKKWPRLVGTKKGPLRFFQGGMATIGNFRRLVEWYEPELRKIDRTLRDRFFTAIDDHDQSASARGEPTLRERFEDLVDRWAHFREDRSVADSQDRARLVGDLRNLLAVTCIDALEPDLVILDEFQRFKHLLEENSPAAELAHSMFNWADEHTQARVLLLSATPYKMYTLSDETEADDHYADFLRTVEFLLEDQTESFVEELGEFRSQLIHLDPTRPEGLMAAKSRVESRLRTVMTRTERLAATKDRRGMLHESVNGGGELTTNDLRAFVALDRAATELESQNPMELWKSAPYFPNFWDEYQIGRHFQRAIDERSGKARVVREILGSSPGLIPWRQFEKYQLIDPGNSRLRQLFGETLNQEAWQLLWLPPALPYYNLGKPFNTEGARTLTKQLVFSAWNAVPKAIATLTSYEAERRMFTSGSGKGKSYPNTPEGREKIPEPLRFPKDRLTSMTAFALIYPSPMLARLGDPFQIASQIRSEGEEPTTDELLRRAEQAIMQKFEQKFRKYHSDAPGTVDNRWYWAAALLLDYDLSTQEEWLRRKRLSEVWTGKDSRAGGDGFDAHLELARQYDKDRLRLGSPPADLGKILALTAVGAPGNVALRALARITPKRRSEYTAEALRDGAARIAWGFRSMFNKPDVQLLIRSVVRKGPYWQKILRYSVDGCLQAVMDEYVYVLREWLGILEIDDESAVTPIADNTFDVVSLQSVDLRAGDPLARKSDRRMRCRFALPFGQYRSEEEKEVRRSGNVRAAFNSPFWPFVLTTTSIGQEGLDFHLYCHSVVHWNLPANPIDLEQREGRVHRYMGHAVRKNLAAAHGKAALTPDVRDPWQTMLEAAVRSRDAEVSDIVPYWVFPGEARIQRHVPALPLSREVGRLHDLKRSLALYRLVFGQPRQEDLIDYLSKQGITQEALKDLLADMRVDLTPPNMPRKS